jgi:hypothetical protein
MIFYFLKRQQAAILFPKTPAGAGTNVQIDTNVQFLFAKKLNS